MQHKITVLAVVMALLVSGTVAVATVQNASAGNTDGSHEISECTTIDEPGEYEVVADITNESTERCIEISADNVTLEGNGHTIDGVNVEGTGVEAYGDNVTIRNVSVTGFAAGVLMYGPGVDPGTRTLTESRIFGNDDGVQVGGPDYVINNTIEDNEGYGVTSVRADTVVVRNNVVVDNGDVGVNLELSSGTLVDNRIAGNAGGGVHANLGHRVQENVQITSKNNVIVDNGAFGVDVEEVTFSSTGDRIVDNDGPGIATFGILTVDNATVVDNDGDGIKVGSNTLKELRTQFVVTDSEVKANAGDGIFLGTTRAFGGGEVHGSVIADNDGLGVNNTMSYVVNATGNDWGSDDGPSSPDDEDAPFEDPKTGALADGSGDQVSEFPNQPGVSNVHFTTEAPEDERADEEAYQIDLATGEVIEDLGEDDDAFYGTQGRLLQAKSLTADGELTRSHGVPQGMAMADDLRYGAISYDAETGEATVTVSLADDASNNATVTLAAYELPGETIEFQRDRADGQELVAHRTVTLSPGDSITLTIDLDGDE